MALAEEAYEAALRVLMVGADAEQGRGLLRTAERELMLAYAACDPLAEAVRSLPAL